LPATENCHELWQRSLVHPFIINTVPVTYSGNLQLLLLLLSASWIFAAPGMEALRTTRELSASAPGKTFLPVIALSADRKMLTSTNVPWIFRPGPETTLAAAVRILADAADHVGLDRGRIREYLTATAFDSSGELVGQERRFAGPLRLSPATKPSSPTFRVIGPRLPGKPSLPRSS
jgi:hypothetical protein